MNNTYSYYAPNVYLAKCTEKHEKGSIIPVTTKRGTDNDSIVFNLIYERDGFYYYSIVRADGFNFQQWAQRRADRRHSWAASAAKKADNYYVRAMEAGKGLTGEPIKIGHHSESHHRRAQERVHENMFKMVEYSKKIAPHESIAEYWESRAKDIKESMPESIDFFTYKLEVAKAKHQELKDNPSKRRHSMSLQYASKDVNELKKKLDLAKRLWA